MKRGEAPKNPGGTEVFPSWLCGVFLVVCILIAYGPARHAGFIWDDDSYLTQNPLLTASDGLRRIWFSLDSPSQYFPLTYTTFYFERALWGLNSAGYHLVNILLHAANALLVWRVLKRLRVPGAWVAAAVFALHPVQVESVAWITERKNVLMGFFFLLSVWAWILFIDSKTKRPVRWYFLSVVFCALALAAKTTACTLSAALLLILWLQKIPITWRRLAQLAPFVAMGVGMGLITVWWEHHHQGTGEMRFGLDPPERVLLASRAIWFYAEKLFWPANLIFSYPRWKISASDLGAYGWLGALVVLALAIWRARRWTGRSVEVAVAFYLVTLSPLLGFFMIYTFAYSYVADHYQYLACIGPIALAVVGVKMALDRAAWGKPFLQPALCVALLATLATLTWRQCGIYTDAETLWRATAARNPDSGLAHNNLGAILRQQGRVDEAIIHNQKALETMPENESIHFNLARALYQQNRFGEAIIQYESALRLDPADVEAENNLAWLLATAPAAALRNGGEAVQLAARANEQTAGKNPIVLGTLAAAYAEAGRFADAIKCGQTAIGIAQRTGQPDLAAKLDRELQHYRTGEASHL